MMNGNERRQKILDTLLESNKEISASQLARQLGVSRQIIVGDVALLRAQGKQVLTTPKGYIIAKQDKKFSEYQVVVKHNAEEAEKELYALVECNVTVYDVIIDHPHYGMIKGILDIKTKEDVEKFIKNKTNLLSNLTNGIHIHTLKYQEKVDLIKAINVLRELQFLHED